MKSFTNSSSIIVTIVSGSRNNRVEIRLVRRRLDGVGVDLLSKCLSPRRIRGILVIAARAISSPATTEGPLTLTAAAVHRARAFACVDRILPPLRRIALLASVGLPTCRATMAAAVGIADRAGAVRVGSGARRAPFVAHLGWRKEVPVVYFLFKFETGRKRGVKRVPSGNAGRAPTGFNSARSRSYGNKLTQRRQAAAGVKQSAHARRKEQTINHARTQTAALPSNASSSLAPLSFGGSLAASLSASMRPTVRRRNSASPQTDIATQSFTRDSIARRGEPRARPAAARRADATDAGAGDGGGPVATTATTTSARPGGGGGGRGVVRARAHRRPLLPHAALREHPRPAPVLPRAAAREHGEDRGGDHDRLGQDRAGVRGGRRVDDLLRRLLLLHPPPTVRMATTAMMRGLPASEVSCIDAGHRVSPITQICLCYYGKAG